MSNSEIPKPDAPGVPAAAPSKSKQPRRPAFYESMKNPVFCECGCCGSYHWRGLPGDNAHRFTADQLDALYGVANWEEITLEDQEHPLISDFGE